MSQNKKGLSRAAKQAIENKLKTDGYLNNNTVETDLKIGLTIRDLQNQLKLINSKYWRYGNWTELDISMNINEQFKEIDKNNKIRQLFECVADFNLLKQDLEGTLENILELIEKEINNDK